MYIPGETQEQRRLRRKAIQNGGILVVHLLQARNPGLREQLAELFDSLEDADILFHFMVLINFVTTGLPGLRSKADGDYSMDDEGADDLSEPLRQETSEVGSAVGTSIH